MARMKKSDPFVSGDIAPRDKEPPLEYPYYTVHHNEDTLYTLNKWDDGCDEPSESYMVNIRPRSVSCSCPGMRHFYGGREEQHKHIRIVRMHIADIKTCQLVGVAPAALKAFWLNKDDVILSRTLLSTRDLEV